MQGKVRCKSIQKKSEAFRFLQHDTDRQKVPFMTHEMFVLFTAY